MVTLDLLLAEFWVLIGPEVFDRSVCGFRTISLQPVAGFHSNLVCRFSVWLLGTDSDMVTLNLLLANPWPLIG